MRNKWRFPTTRTNKLEIGVLIVFVSFVAVCCYWIGSRQLRTLNVLWLASNAEENVKIIAFARHRAAAEQHPSHRLGDGSELVRVAMGLCINWVNVCHVQGGQSEKSYS